jgi:hypothetical protein
MIQTICPQNSEHQSFSTVVTVQQNCIIDSSGNIVEKFSSDEIILDGPGSNRSCVCIECGSEAKTKHT